MKRALLVVLAMLLASPAFAANKFVRQGASGSGNGSDWTNACTSFAGSCDPSSLTRGDTYYVADTSSSLGSVTFSTANSGTNYITIKKCSTSDGVSPGIAGYSSTFCDGQAVLGEIVLTTDYWRIDGTYRNEASWGTEGDYGFRIGGVTSNSINFGHCADNVEVKYVRAGGTSSSSFAGPYGESFYLGGFSEVCENWIITRVMARNSDLLFQIAGADNVEISYSWLGYNWSKEIIRSQVQGTNLKIYNNYMENGCRDDHDPGTGCTAEIGLFDSAGGHDGTQICGNVIVKDIAQQNSDGCIMIANSPQGGVPDNITIANNTLYNNGTAGFCGFRIQTGGTGNVIKNNLQYLPGGMADQCTGGTCSDNSLYTSSPPFVNLGAGDYHLTSNITGTTRAASPCDVDIDGVTRNATTATRGAYEFSAGGGVPGAPGNFRLNQPPWKRWFVEGASW